MQHKDLATRNHFQRICLSWPISLLSLLPRKPDSEDSACSSVFLHNVFNKTRYVYWMAGEKLNCRWENGLLSIVNRDIFKKMSYLNSVTRFYLDKKGKGHTYAWRREDLPYRVACYLSLIWSRSSSMPAATTKPVVSCRAQSSRPQRGKAGRQSRKKSNSNQHYIKLLRTVKTNKLKQF